VFSEMRLANKVALIVGAGERMSRAAALLFAQEGAITRTGMSWDQLSRLACNVDGTRQAGYTIPCEPVYRPFGSTASSAQSMSLYIVDPEGNLLELVGRPKGSPWRTPGTGAH
jgi:hypothetical protein